VKPRGCCQAPGTVGAAYDGAGGLWGGVVEQLGPPDPGNAIPTSGYVGRLVSAAQALTAP